MYVKENVVYISSPSLPTTSSLLYTLFHTLFRVSFCFRLLFLPFISLPSPSHAFSCPQAKYKNNLSSLTFALSSLQMIISLSLCSVYVFKFCPTHVLASYLLISVDHMFLAFNLRYIYSIATYYIYSVFTCIKS